MYYLNSLLEYEKDLIFAAKYKKDIENIKNEDTVENQTLIVK